MCYFVIPYFFTEFIYLARTSTRYLVDGTPEHRVRPFTTAGCVHACIPFTTTAARVHLVADLEDGPDVVRAQPGRARQGDLHDQVEP